MFFLIQGLYVLAGCSKRWLMSKEFKLACVKTFKKALYLTACLYTLQRVGNAG